MGNIEITDVNKILGLLLVCLISFYIGYLFGESKQQASDGFDVAINISEDDAVYGNREAKVLIFEYSDYECPFCARFHPVAKEVVDESGGDVAWVYRHLPLAIHETAEYGSILGSCVLSNLGNEKFWEYTDTIFKEGLANIKYYRDLAKNVGLSVDQIDECLIDNSDERDLVDSHIGQSIVFGITGTPGGFIAREGREPVRLAGAIPKTELDRIIKSLLR